MENIQGFLEEQLDTAKARLTELEKELVVQQETLYTMVDQLKETQRFLIKLAHNQAEVAKRISSWPFISVKTRGDEDA